MSEADPSITPEAYAESSQGATEPERPGMIKGLFAKIRKFRQNRKTRGTTEPTEDENENDTPDDTVKPATSLSDSGHHAEQLNEMNDVLQNIQDISQQVAESTKDTTARVEDIAHGLDHLDAEQRRRFMDLNAAQKSSFQTLIQDTKATRSEVAETKQLLSETAALIQSLQMGVDEHWVKGQDRNKKLLEGGLRLLKESIQDQMANQEASARQNLEALEDFKSSIVQHLESLQEKFVTSLSSAKFVQATQEHLKKVEESMQATAKRLASAPTASLEEKIATLKATRLREVRPDPMYIVLRCGVTPTEPEDEKSPSGEDTVEAALDSTLLEGPLDDVHTLVLLGPSGAGKSTVMQRLETELWSRLNVAGIGREHQYVPLFMELKKMSLTQNQGKDLQWVALSELGSILSQIDLLDFKDKKLTPIWLLDGFDEMGHVLSLSSDLFKCGKAIISCRQQFVDSILNGNLAKYFEPRDPRSYVPYPFSIRYLRAFSRRQIREYLGKLFIANDHLHTYGSPETFGDAIESLPSLSDMASNPFSLSIISERLPSLAKQFPIIGSALEGNLDKASTTCKSEVKSIDILRRFVEDYFERSIRRFVLHPNWPRQFELRFSEACQQFCEDLAVIMCSQKEKTYVADTNEPVFAAMFDADPETLAGVKRSFILQAVPLRKTGPTTWAFMHKSLWEYFLACRNVPSISASIMEEKAISPGTRSGPKDSLPSLIETLGLSLFTQDRDLLQKHAELLVDKPESQALYFDVVLSTRAPISDDAEKDGRLVTAASNAISVLNYGHANHMFVFDFNEAQDWSHIRVPGANLDFAEISECNFDGADLSGSTMIQTRAQSTSFRGANLTGVIYGRENP